MCLLDPHLKPSRSRPTCRLRRLALCSFGSMKDVYLELCTSVCGPSALAVYTILSVLGSPAIVELIGPELMHCDAAASALNTASAPSCRPEMLWPAMKLPYSGHD